MTAQTRRPAGPDLREESDVPQDPNRRPTWPALCAALTAIVEARAYHDLPVVVLYTGALAHDIRTLTAAQLDAIRGAMTDVDIRVRPAAEDGTAGATWLRTEEGKLGGAWSIELYEFFDGPPVQGCEPPPGTGGWLSGTCADPQPEPAVRAAAPVASAPVSNASGWPAGRPAPFPRVRAKLRGRLYPSAAQGQA